MSLLRKAPKPVRDDTPDPREITFKAHIGSDGALFALINNLREIGKVKQGRYQKRGDGSIEQTITIEVYTLARSYATPPERPFVDLRGYAYCVEGLSTGRIKFGGTNDTDRRLGELEREFREPFKRRHVVHCENWKRTEKMVHDYLKAHGLHEEREFYSMPEWAFEWFVALPNE